MLFIINNKQWKYLGLVSYLFIGIIFVFLGDINPDEGYYLLGSNLVYEGKLPYRDFAFSQTPITLYIHGLLQKIHPGIVTGRLVSLLLAMLGYLALIDICQRLELKYWPVLLFATAATSAYQMSQLTQVKGYAPAAFFSVAAFYSLVRLEIWGGLWFIMFSFLATGCRLSSAVIYLTALYVMYVYIKNQGKFQKRHWFYILMLIVLISLCVIIYSEQFGYHVITFHKARHIGSGIDIIVGKAMFLLALIRYYPSLIIGLFIGLGLSLLTSRRTTFNEKEILLIYGTGIFFTGTLAAHLTVQVTALDAHYQATSLFALVLLVLILVDRVIISMTDEFTYILLCLLVVTSVVTCIVDVRALISMPEGMTPVGQVQTVAGYLRKNLPADARVLTPDTYIIAQAGLDVLPGYEGCYFYPQWNRDKAEKFNVINTEMLLEDIRQQRADALLLKDSSFARRYPDYRPVAKETQELIWNEINKYYNEKKRIPNFGKWRDEEIIYIKKTNSFK